MENKTEQNTIQQRFLEILQKILDNKSIELSTRLQETALDSLKYITLVVEVEKAFTIKFDDESLLLHNFTLVQDLAGYIEQKCLEQAN
jgi:acyl carrier protein